MINERRLTFDHIRVILHMMSIKILVPLALLLTGISSKCAYTQPKEGLPYIYDGEAFPMNYSETQQICKEYIGEDVCCN